MMEKCHTDLTDLASVKGLAAHKTTNDNYSRERLVAVESSASEL